MYGEVPGELSDALKSISDVFFIKYLPDKRECSGWCIGRYFMMYSDVLKK
jgi:hypothetical protein